MIIHILDGASDDPIRDFCAINNELKLYSPLLASKPQVVVVNKIDLPLVADRLESLLYRLHQEMPHKRLLTMSAANGINVQEVVERTHNFLCKIKMDNYSAG